MKNFLSKTLFWGFIFIKAAEAQPIQLLPQKNELPTLTQPAPTLQDANGIWEGTPPSLIETYFSKVPINLTSITLRKIRADILNVKYAPLLNNPTYEKDYLSILMKIGLFTEAKDFLVNSTLPEKETLLIDLQWLEGEPKKACEKIANLIRTSPSLEWKKQNIYCLHLNGEDERGKVAAELLRETNPDDFAPMSALFDPTSKPPFDHSIASSPFLLTVWATTAQELTEKDLSELSPSQLAIVARSGKIPIKTRLLAGIKALQQGSLTADRFDNLLKEGPSEDILVKLRASLSNPKTETLLPLLERVYQNHNLELVVTVFKSKIDPSPELVKLAPFLIRAYLIVWRENLAKNGSLYINEKLQMMPLVYRPSSILHFLKQSGEKPNFRLGSFIKPIITLKKLLNIHMN